MAEVLPSTSSENTETQNEDVPDPEDNNTEIVPEKPKKPLNVSKKVFEVPNKSKTYILDVTWSSTTPIMAKQISAHKNVRWTCIDRYIFVYGQRR